MVKIKVVLSATNRAWGYLFKEEERKREIERFKKKLEEIKDKLPEDLELEIHSFTNSSEEINFISSLNGKESVIYCALSAGTPGLKILLEKNIPMVFYQQMYAYHTWNIKELRKDNVIIFMGSEINDFIKKIRILYAYMKIPQSKYLLITTEKRKDILERKEILQEKFNFNGELIKPEELIRYYQNSNKEEAEKMAKEFIKNSIGIIEPTYEEIIDAYRMYLGMENLIKDKGADGITIDCLTLFGLGVMPAYPCIGFTFLNDRGIPAACEGDVFHAGALCQHDPFVRVETGWIEALLELFVFLDRDFFVEHDPFAAAEQRVDPPVDEETELRILEPFHVRGIGIKVFPRFGRYLFQCSRSVVVDVLSGRCGL